MKNLLPNLEGDARLWGIFFLLAVVSFFSVYSAISNIAFLHHEGNTLTVFLRHIFYYVFGFILVYYVSKVNLKYIKNLPVILFPIVIFLLFYTLTQGVTIGEATRWIRLPFIGVSFQTSELAKFILIMLLARNLVVYKDKLNDLKTSLLHFIFPIGLVCLLILPSNLSTTALVFTISLIVLFVGNFPIRKIVAMLGSGIFLLLIFTLLNLAFPNLMPDRVGTWINRIENFTLDNPKDNFQVQKAKIAIANGGFFGQGPGKSTQKNFLPQSSSDFIFAVIVEEWGLLGGVFILMLYFYFLIRVVNIARRNSNEYLSLIAIGTGLGIVFQAFINMGVAVNLLPVTGQTLPMISTGGTSLWITCIALGIILNISRKKYTQMQIVV